MKLEVQFGELTRTLGSVVRQGPWSLQAADVDLEGNVFTPSYDLAEHVPTPVPAVLEPLLEAELDALWVRARIPVAFNHTPQLAEREKSLLDVGFVATRQEGTRLEAYAFRCGDYYGQTSLSFSPNGPSDETQAAIAQAFWSILLDKPSDLADFSEAVFHPGVGIWMHFSCVDGELEYSESEDEQGDADEQGAPNDEQEADAQ